LFLSPLRGSFVPTVNPTAFGCVAQLQFKMACERPPPSLRSRLPLTEPVQVSRRRQVTREGRSRTFLNILRHGHKIRKKGGKADLFLSVVGQSTTAASLSRLCAVQSKLHSADTLFRPRSKNCRNPRA